MIPALPALPASTSSYLCAGPYYFSPIFHIGLNRADKHFFPKARVAAIALVKLLFDSAHFIRSNIVTFVVTDCFLLAYARVLSEK